MNRTRPWYRAAGWTLPAVLALVGASIRGQVEQPDRALEGLFTVGAMLQDKNGDGTVDFVTARVVLGDRPSSSDVAAAASVAARLGLETSAMTLPLTAADPDEQLIAIGTAGARRAGVTSTALGLEQLADGEGVVRSVVQQGRRIVIAAGRDDEGTRAAAMLLAGRLPYLGDAKGPTLQSVVDDVRKLLDGAGAGVRSIGVPAVRTSGPGGAISVVDVEIRVAAAADIQRVRRALAGARTQQAGRGVAKAQPAPREASPGDATAQPQGAPLSYEAVPVINFRIAASQGAPAEVRVRREEEPPARPAGGRPGAGAKEDLDLSNLYASDGLLGDADTNLIPDRFDAVLVPSGDGLERTLDLAARLGLESAGAVFPVAVPAEAVRKPEAEATMVLIGVAHPLVDDLVKKGKFTRPALAAGEGLIQVVRKAFGEKGAVIVTGGDAAGLDRALEQMAERLPHVWSRGKDRTTLEDVEEAARRFVSQRSPAGQAASALYMIKRIGRQLAGKQLESAAVSVHVMKAEEGLERVVREHVASTIKGGKVDVSVENLDVLKAGKIFDEDLEVPSEVARFQELFDAKVLPAVRKGKPVAVEVRLSEPPHVRERLAREARERLISKGADPASTSVVVLSAYKQGYSWLYDVIRPRLEGKGADRITIRFAEIGPPPEWSQQAMFPPTRWLLELFPIAEVLARDLRLDVNRITLEKRPIGSPTYEVVATGADGREILKETFEPKFVLRPFFDRFPDYERVRVTTGWITASVDGRAVADERIVTDLEWFWDHYQAKVLPRMYDYVMKIGNGKPDPADAPYFGELVVDVTLSEPDYPLGIDKEQIAPMEALHEEIYFNTLHFFDVIGRHSRGRGLDYPGRVIPIVRPKADGQAGRAKITFTGFQSIRPAVVVKYREAGGRTGEIRRDIRPVAVERPSALSLTVRAGRDGIERLDLRLKVDSERDEREALVARARRERVDQQIISAEQVVAMTAHLGRLRAAGLYRDALAFHDLTNIRLTPGWTHDVDAKQQTIAALEPNGAPEPWPDIRKLLPPGYRHAGERLVQWDTPMPPGEAYEVLAKMSTFAEATVYKVGESYLGKDIWAMDLMPSIDASHWSQAKQTTFKPTVVYSARQHANEVSSTSHVLRLAELLLTDPAFRKKLDAVNVVIHPITNPDGAQLAYDLQKITPDHMLHAGYLGSLGVDMTSGQWEGDPIYPESTVRPRLWRTWRPDIFLNPHGYPSHEWVQLFSEYAGWVRNRVTESRDWWGMRGWFIPGFGYVDDPKFPRHKAAAFEIRKRITENINAAPAVRALNQRAYERYRRYGFAHDDENFKLDFTNDVLIYTAVKGSRASAQSQDFMTRQPKITIWTGGTEAPDETARGEWMELVATAGLQWDKAILDYLVEGRHTVDRKADTFFGGATMSFDRPRPPKPDPKEKAVTDPVGGGKDR